MKKFIIPILVLLLMVGVVSATELTNPVLYAEANLIWDAEGLTDSSQAELDLTVGEGSPVYISDDCRIGGCVNYSGAEAHSTLTSRIFPNEDFMWCFWVNPDASQVDYAMILGQNKGDATDYSYASAYRPDQGGTQTPQVEVPSPTVRWSRGSDIRGIGWIHICHAKNSSHLTNWENGTQVNSTAIPSDVTNTGQTIFAIGAGYESSYGYNYVGILDELYMFNSTFDDMGYTYQGLTGTAAAVKYIYSLTATLDNNIIISPDDYTDQYNVTEEPSSNLAFALNQTQMPYGQNIWTNPNYNYIDITAKPATGTTFWNLFDTDDLWSSNDGTDSGTVTATTYPTFNTSGDSSPSSTYFGGADDFITSSYYPSSGASDWAISFWMNSTDVLSGTDYVGLFYWGERAEAKDVQIMFRSYSPHPDCVDNSSTAYFGISGWNMGTVFCVNQSEVINGEWHHVVIGVNNGEQDESYLWIDGVNITRDSASSRTWNVGATLPLRLGQLYWAGAADYEGHMDHIQFFTAEPTEEEIYNLYNYGFVEAPATQPDVMFYANNASSMVVADSNNNTIPWCSEEYGIGYESSLVYSDDAEAVYHFGDTADSNYTMSNGVAGMTGKLGNALHYDGANSCTQADSSIITSTESFSVSVWVNDTDDNGKVLGNGDNTNGFYIYIGTGASDEDFTIRFGGSSHTVSTTKPYIVNNGWTHIVVTYNDTDDKLNSWVDGVKKHDDVSVTPVAANDNMFFGNWYDCASAPYTGGIDDVRFYNKTISTEERDALYNSGLGTQYEDVAPDYLIEHYTFESGADSTGNNNDLTVNGATSSTDGLFGNAMDFDGTNDYATALGTLSAVDEDMSIVMWVKPETVSTDEYWFYKGDGTTNNNMFRIGTDGTDNDLITVEQRAGGTFAWTLDSTSSLDNSNWSQIVVTCTSGNQSLFIDGVMEDTEVDTGTGICDNTAFDDLFVAAYVTPGNYYDGIIDDFRIYKTALTYTEVQETYNNSVDGVNMNLVPMAAGAAVTINSVTQTPDGDNYTHNFTANVTTTGTAMDTVIIQMISPISSSTINYTMSNVSEIYNLTNFNTNETGSWNYTVFANDTDGNTAEYSELFTGHEQITVRINDVTHVADWSNHTHNFTANVTALAISLGALPSMADSLLYFSMDNDNMSGNNPLNYSGPAYGSSATVAGATGIRNEALRYNSGYTNTIANIFGTDGTGAYSGWMKRDALPSGSSKSYRLISNERGQSPEFDAYVSGTTFVSRMYSVTLSAPAGGLDWIHLAASWNSTYAAIYVNGTRVNNVSGTPGYNAETFAFRVGADWIHSASRLDGWLDEVFVWDRQVSDSEISQIYNDGAGFNPYEPLLNEVDTVIVELESPISGTKTNYTMSYSAGDLYAYTEILTNETGTNWTYKVYANDSFGQLATSSASFTGFDGIYFSVDNSSYNFSSAYYADEQANWSIDVTDRIMTADLSPTVLFDTNFVSNCAIDDEDLNYTDMIAGSGDNCTVTGGTSHVCTLSTNLTVTPANHELYIGCEEEFTYSGQSSTPWGLPLRIGSITLAALSPADDATVFYKDRPFTLSALVSGTEGNSNCSLYLNGTLNDTNTDIPTGVSSFIKNLSRGHHDWNFTCVNGPFTDSVSRTLIVNNTAPTNVQIVYPLNNSNFYSGDGSAVTIDVNYTADDEDGDELTFWLQVFDEINQSNTGNTTLDLGPRSDEYSLTVWADDGYVNVSSTSVYVNVTNLSYTLSPCLSDFELNISTPNVTGLAPTGQSTAGCSYNITNTHDFDVNFQMKYLGNSFFPTIQVESFDDNIFGRYTIKEPTNYVCRDSVEYALILFADNFTGEGLGNVVSHNYEEGKWKVYAVDGDNYSVNRADVMEYLFRPSSATNASTARIVELSSGLTEVRTANPNDIGKEASWLYIALSNSISSGVNPTGTFLATFPNTDDNYNVSSWAYVHATADPGGRYINWQIPEGTTRASAAAAGVGQTFDYFGTDTSAWDSDNPDDAEVGYNANYHNSYSVSLNTKVLVISDENPAWVDTVTATGSGFTKTTYFYNFSSEGVPAFTFGCESPYNRLCMGPITTDNEELRVTYNFNNTHNNQREYYNGSEYLPINITFECPDTNSITFEPERNYSTYDLSKIEYKLVNETDVNSVAFRLNFTNSTGGSILSSGYTALDKDAWTSMEVGLLEPYVTDISNYSIVLEGDTYGKVLFRNWFLNDTDGIPVQNMSFYAGNNTWNTSTNLTSSYKIVFNMSAGQTMPLKFWFDFIEPKLGTLVDLDELYFSGAAI